MIRKVQHNKNYVVPGTVKIIAQKDMFFKVFYLISFLVTNSLQYNFLERIFLTYIQHLLEYIEKRDIQHNFCNVVFSSVLRKLQFNFKYYFVRKKELYVT